jgi:hypothetical protein
MVDHYKKNYDCGILFHKIKNNELNLEYEDCDVFMINGLDQ